MQHELNTPPPGGWPVGTVCEITEAGSRDTVGTLVEVLELSEPARANGEAHQRRGVPVGDPIQLCQIIQTDADMSYDPDSGRQPRSCGFWASAWMRPIDPDATPHRETEREVTA